MSILLNPFVPPSMKSARLNRNGSSRNQANQEYNKVVPRARGEADQKISAAEGYALKRINEAQGDATRFKALFSEYEKAPEVTGGACTWRP